MTTLWSRIFELPADVVECFPHESQCNGFMNDVYDIMKNIFVIGTYKLVNRDTQLKIGRLYCYRVDSNDDNDHTSGVQVSELWSPLDTEAIFDLKWCNRPLSDDTSTPWFGMVDTTGKLSLYRVSSDAQSTELVTSSVPQEVAPALSLDWSCTGEPECVVSYGDGSVRIYSYSNGANVLTNEWSAHDNIEVWNVAFDRYSAHRIVYSGGDDCAFKGWDTRQSLEIPSFNIMNRHDGGVCTIVDSPHDPHVLVTGSYDEHIRWWDKRRMARPVHTLAMGGGVWKVRYHHSKPNCLVAACMHNGFHVVDDVVNGDKSTPQIVVSYENHKDLAYGCSWFPKHPSMLATCSFYDCQADVWQY